MLISRRSILTGLLAAPIIVRPGLLMPIKPIIEDWWNDKLVPLPPGEYNIVLQDFQYFYDKQLRTVFRITGVEAMEGRTVSSLVKL